MPFVLMALSLIAFAAPALAAAPPIEMVFVKGGCYEMGNTFGAVKGPEAVLMGNVKHEVCLDDFYLGKYEVTQEQWQAVMGGNPSHFASCGSYCPVEMVSWHDVQAFIKKLNQESGKRYRLPTEAEWEYAARGAGRQEKWAGTSSEAALRKYAWYRTNSGGKTHVVGSRLPNALDLHDMSGNVSEWCQDWYDAGYYAKSPRENPPGPRTGKLRVIRGGGIHASADGARIYDRLLPFDPGSRLKSLGFRIALPAGGR